MLLQSVHKLIAKVLEFMILGLRPLLGPAVCRHPISCTIFAIEQLKKEPLYKAVPAVIKRLFLCIAIW